MIKNNKISSDDFSEEAILQRIKNLERVIILLNGDIKIAPTVKTLSKFLSLLSDVTVEIDRSIDPDEFLRTHDGLWVGPELETLLGGTAEKIEEHIELSKYSICKNAGSVHIKNELSDRCIFEIGIFRTMIASFINEQQNGVKGVLLNKDHANIFYVWNQDKTTYFAVHVYWFSDSKRWNIYIFDSEEDEWSAGLSTVFFRS